MQSIHAPTLEFTKRQNIALETYQTLQHRFSRDGVATYSDLILALPGETYDSFAEGVSTLIAGGQHNRIQFANLSILPNAEMADLAYRERHGFETVITPILNMHGSLSEEPEEVRELQELVVATRAMPRPDWVRARAFAWMTAFLHFDKLMQIPFIVLHEATGIAYRDMIEAFLDVDSGTFPVTASVRDDFLARATEIQAGGPEFRHAPAWLDIWWPDDEYAFIRLAVDGRLDAFLDEGGRILERLARAAGHGTAAALLADAIAVNSAAINRPGRREDVTVAVGHDVLSAWKGALGGQPAAPRPGRFAYRLSRADSSKAELADWCREIVWYGNKKGAYLHAAEALAGTPMPPDARRDGTAGTTLGTAASP